eukprot:s849_g11.t1
MASDPNRWFDWLETFRSISQSDGLAVAEAELSKTGTKDLQSLCGVAGIPIDQPGGKSKTKKDMVGDLMGDLRACREAVVGLLLCFCFGFWLGRVFDLRGRVF